MAVSIPAVGAVVGSALVGWLIGLTEWSSLARASLSGLEGVVSGVVVLGYRLFARFADQAKASGVFAVSVGGAEFLLRVGFLALSVMALHFLLGLAMDRLVLVPSVRCGAFAGISALLTLALLGRL